MNRDEMVEPYRGGLGGGRGERCRSDPSRDIEVLEKGEVGHGVV